MWICPKCNESIEDHFDSCKKCDEKLPQAQSEYLNDFPLSSALSLVCPICAIVILLLFVMAPHHGNGNLEIFPQGLVVVILSCLGLGIVGLISGFIGLAKGRWPIAALIGIILSGLLLLIPFS
jgi:hypothetical protein